MRRIVSALSVLGFFVVAGCGGDSLIDLATYKPTSLQVIFDKTTNAPLGIALTGADQVSSDGCPVIQGTVRAQVDSLVLNRSGSGGTALGLDVDPTTCGPTEWTLPKQIPESLKGSATSTITIGPNNEVSLKVSSLFADRKLTVLDPADGNLVAGQMVTLGWSAGTDELDSGKLTLKLQPNGGTAVDVEPSLNDGENTLTFTVPQGISGAATIRASGAFAQPKLEACTGVTACSTVLKIESILPVTVQ